MNIFTKPYKVIYTQGEIQINADEAKHLYEAFLGGHDYAKINNRYLPTNFRTMHPVIEEAK